MNARAAVLALLLAATVREARASETVAGREWARLPTEHEIDAAWPAAAKSVEGHAVLDCAVGASGELETCKVGEERPAGLGFGAAALALAPRFARVAPSKDGSLRVAVRIQWSRDDADRQPDWLKRPTPEMYKAVWPVEAARTGKGGDTKIDCVVTVQGAVRDCWIVSEDPPGSGFGIAALTMSQQFLFKPAIKAGQPVEKRVTIPVKFGSGMPWLTGPVTRIIRDAPWTVAPSPADVTAVYPEKALARAVAGRVVLRCGFARSGELKSCETIAAKPADMGFEAAARKLIPKFRGAVEGMDPQTLKSIQVELAIEFAPSEPQPRYLPKAVWTREINPEAMLALFPAKAADAGVSSGRVVLDCGVAAGGGLTDCKIMSEDPAGMDFGVVAAELAKVMAVNPWTEDGLPTEGARIRFAVRVEHKEPEPATKP